MKTNIGNSTGAHWISHKANFNMGSLIPLLHPFGQNLADCPRVEYHRHKLCLWHGSEETTSLQGSRISIHPFLSRGRFSVKTPGAAVLLGAINPVLLRQGAFSSAGWLKHAKWEDLVQLIGRTRIPP